MGPKAEDGAAAAAVELTAPSAASERGEGGIPSAEEGVVSSEVSSAVFTSPFSVAATAQIESLVVAVVGAAAVPLVVAVWDSNQ